MKKRGLCLLVIFLAVVLSGCGMISDMIIDSIINDKSKDTEREEKNVMTERQEEIFRSYGISEERIAQMKEEGMNFNEKSFVDAAIVILDHLEEKYNEKFEVVGGDIPGLFMRDYWIKARACEGEHAGKEFDVYHKGELGIYDGYINYLKEEEAVEALKELIHEEFSDVFVSAKMIGEYGDKVTVDMKGEKLLHNVRYSYYMIIISKDMDENSFIHKVECIQKFLDNNNINSSGSVFCFADEIDKNISHNELKHLIINDINTNKELVRWSDFISTR